MMFAMRGIAVSFSVFVVLYCVLSVVVCAVWRRVWLASQQILRETTAPTCFSPCAWLHSWWPPESRSLLAVPSFLLLEPRAVDEPMGVVPVVLSLCGMAADAGGNVEGGGGIVRASRTVARWSSEARVAGYALPDSRDTFVLRISAAAPPLTAAGILRPSVWLSRAAEFVLTERELKTALRHEMVHVRRRDNLRKLVLRLVAFPGMAELESVWREATEMAADDAAVSTASEALDLAAAVIKLSRLTATGTASGVDHGFSPQSGGVGECACGTVDCLDRTAADAGSGIFVRLSAMRCVRWWSSLWPSLTANCLSGCMRRRSGWCGRRSFPGRSCDRPPAW